MSDAVVLEAVAFSYAARTALDGVSFAVAAGESFGIMGPNGSGKSTLFGLLSTRLAPARGSVRILDADTAADPQAVRARIGIVPQGATLDRFLTVEENLRAWAGLHGLGAARTHEAVEAALGAAGLADRRRDRAGTLSGGLARRAELARALLHDPAILLLDEPTAALDPAARAEWRDRLDDVRRTRALTVITMTHDLYEAGRCDRVAIMAAGRIVAIGTPAALREGVGAAVITVTPAGAAQPLRDRLAAALDVPAAVVDGRIRFTHPEAHALVAKIASVAGADAIAVTVSRPSLGEAFVSLTGTRWEEGG